jgi:hypothetical protein
MVCVCVFDPELTVTISMSMFISHLPFSTSHPPNHLPTNRQPTPINRPSTPTNTAPPVLNYRKILCTITMQVRYPQRSPPVAATHATASAPSAPEHASKHASKQSTAQQSTATGVKPLTYLGRYLTVSRRRYSAAKKKKHRRRRQRQCRGHPIPFHYVQASERAAGDLPFPSLSASAEAGGRPDARTIAWVRACMRRGGGEEGREVRGHDAIRLRYGCGVCARESMGEGVFWVQGLRGRRRADGKRWRDGCGRRTGAAVVCCVVAVVVVVVSKGAGARRRAAEST